MGIFNATATYGRGFKPTDSPDRLSIRIYTGGFAGPKTADARVEKEIKAYLQEKQYKSHAIVTRSRKWIPSCYEYIVQFSQEAVQQSPGGDSLKAAPQD